MAGAKLHGSIKDSDSLEGVQGALGLITGGELDKAVARVAATDGVDGDVNLLILESCLLEDSLDVGGLDAVQKVAHVDASALGDGGC